MDNYPSNSEKSKEVPISVENRATIKEHKGLVEKVSTSIMDSAVDIAKNTVKSTLIPSFKDMIYNTFNETLRGLLYGKNGYPKSTTRTTSYSTTTTTASNGTAGYLPATPSLSWKNDWNKVTFNSIGEAEACLYKMRSAANSSDGVISVKDFFNFAGFRIDDWTASNIGWNIQDLNRSTVRSTGDGDYYIDLKKPERIK